LDGKDSDFSENDRARRNTIVNLLKEWALIDVVREDDYEAAPLSQIKILSHKEKDGWELVPKYNIGRKR
jgi:hypothetical protein